jgi:AraC family transcriptional regulator of adaptative response / DNA-3-methyladenine glycosylase II
MLDGVWGEPSSDARWRRARQSRDARFDGRFYIGVVTTGIYCRPVCPAPSPRESNVRYFASAAAATEAGFRPCLRCRPEVAPGTPVWSGTSATVRRALRLIDDGVADGINLEDLAGRLGIGGRHLRRLFLQHLGVSPRALLHTRRLHFAKQLIDGTGLPFAAVAMSSGYGSIRRFNAAVMETWGRTPSALRKSRPEGSAPGFRFRLAYRPPYDWSAMLRFLERRAVHGLEVVVDGRYLRTIVVNDRGGSIEVSHDGPGRALVLQVQHPDPRAIYTIVRRVRAMFDVDADPGVISTHLRTDASLASRVQRSPGLRIPGGWDRFELIVRAVAGQQTSVAAATTFVSRLTERFGGRVAGAPGGPTRMFPGPATLSDAPLEDVGLTRSRADAIRSLARATVVGELDLNGELQSDALVARLRSLPGIGPWTAAYVAMRAFNDPDAFPSGDLGLQRATGLSERELRIRSERWRPWRAYATIHFWMGETDEHDRALHHHRQSGRAAAARGNPIQPVRAAVRARA